MSNYDNLVGLPYDEGKQDCYSIVRRYYSQVWGLELPNLARPTRFWEDPDLDLYQRYQSFGFKPVFDEPWQIGDALLMPLRTPFATHAAVIVEDNKILHHLPGQLSTIEPTRPRWSNLATIVLRHPHITEVSEGQFETIAIQEVVDANIFRDPAFQEATRRVLEPED